MEQENIEIEELLERIKKLEEENEKLKKSKRKKRRPAIKTTVEEIIDYWEQREDETDLSVDWSDAHEICWRCGCERKLQKCHIIPHSLGGTDEPSNLVLLCERCHIDAPNINSKTFMWDWIRSNSTTFYDTFWQQRAEKEYEFIYKKSYLQELKERGIYTPRDADFFQKIPYCKTSRHFAHPWRNDSTMAGLLRMKLEDYDRKYANKTPKDFPRIVKEWGFDFLVQEICAIAKEYNWNVWEGRTKNPYSVTVSAWLDKNKYRCVSIKLCRGNVFKACIIEDYEPNPNNIKASEYNIVLGEEAVAAEQFVRAEIETFSDLYGLPEMRRFAFTINSKCYFLCGEE